MIIDHDGSKRYPSRCGLAAASCLAAVLAASCTGYKPDPVDLAAETEQWQRASKAMLPQRTPGYESLRQLGLILNPALNAARIKSASSRDAVRQAGWWQDPSVSVDVQRILHEGGYDYGAGFSLTIPVTGLPGLEKKAAAHYAEKDYWDLRQAEADYLASFDQAWNALGIASERERLAQRRLETLRGENELIGRLTGLGEGSQAERQVAAQRQNDAVTAVQTAARERQACEQNLVRLLGVHPDSASRLAGAGRKVGGGVPSAVAVLSPAALAASPRVRAQLAAYGVGETQLQTEIRKQYPEISLGPLSSREDGEKKMGGSIGFDLPLWNRNRAAIAAARGNRDLVRQETVQLWRAQLLGSRQLDETQKLLLAQCRDETARIAELERGLSTLEKLYAVGESPMSELADARQQVYERRLAYLDTLAALWDVQARLTYLVFNQ